MWRKYIDSSCKKIQGLIAKHIILVGFLLLAGVYGLDRLAPAGVVFDAGYCLPIVLVAWHRHVKSTMIVSALAFAANLQMTLWEAGGAPAYSLLVYRGLSRVCGHYASQMKAAATHMKAENRTASLS